MNIYTYTDFKGHWPVGVAAVMVAENRDQAVELLEKRLNRIGLAQTIDSKKVILVSTSSPHVLILNDGNY